MTDNFGITAEDTLDDMGRVALIVIAVVALIAAAFSMQWWVPLIVEWL